MAKKSRKRIPMLRPIHGKITSEGKVSEPDIQWIIEKWLERHPEVKAREETGIRVFTGQWTTQDGLRTEVRITSIVEGDDIAGYQPEDDIDLYEYYLAEDRFHESG